MTTPGPSALRGTSAAAVRRPARRAGEIVGTGVGFLCLATLLLFAVFPLLLMAISSVRPATRILGLGCSHPLRRAGRL